MNRLTAPLKPAAPAVPMRGLLQRKCACGGETVAGGECAECARKKGTLQRKLRIGEVNDPLEHEADRVADQVMSQSAETAIGHSPPRIQRLRNSGGDFEGEVPDSVTRTLAGSGRPLDASLRQIFEPRFGRDFSGVRVHQGGLAEQSARDVNARAYTVGNDIVLGAGEYVAGSATGQRLLAHELTHVVQQGNGGESRVQRTLAGCQELLADPSVVSLISGSVVHQMIGQHFQGSVAEAVTVAIPGASAGPLRSQGICGGDTRIISPQLIGGLAGAGIPDLARKTQAGILQVAEIKPAAVPCLIDGEEQMLRYIDQGNARDAGQAAWRSSLGVSVVTPMLESAYSPPSFQVSLPGVANANLRTAWCSPGLLAYSVSVSGNQIRIPVPRTVRARERDKLQRESTSLAPVVAAAATVAAAAVGRALWRHFWRIVVRRFAVRGAIALALSAADGPLPFGELFSLGMALVTIVQIVGAWDELWNEADQLAGEQA